MYVRNSLTACRALAASALLCAASVAEAKGEVYRSRCNRVNPPAEDIIDRPDHRVTSSQSVCEVSGGVLGGGIMTAHTIYEWNGQKATLLSGGGVMRKAGMVVVYKHLEGHTDLTDPKSKQYAGTGRGVIAIASGAAASMTGKTYTFRIVMENGKPVFEVTMD